MKGILSIDIKIIDAYVQYDHYDQMKKTSIFTWLLSCSVLIIRQHSIIRGQQNITNNIPTKSTASNWFQSNIIPFPPTKLSELQKFRQPKTIATLRTRRPGHESENDYVIDARGVPCRSAVIPRWSEVILIVRPYNSLLKCVTSTRYSNWLRTLCFVLTSQTVSQLSLSEMW